LSIWDFVILVILLAGAYQGYQKGLLMAVTGLFALLAGMIGAVAWTPDFLAYISQRSDLSPEILSILAFLAIFIGIVIALNIVGKLIKIVIDLTPLGAIDGLIGAMLGLLKWALGVSIILWVLDKAEISFAADEPNSILVYVRQVAPYVFAQIIDWSPYFQELLKNIEKVIVTLRK
jgi:membrane protein required for colicin V production